jgi:hypothetical protein
MTVLDEPEDRVLRSGESDLKLDEVPNPPPAGPVGLSAQSGLRFG